MLTWMAGMKEMDIGQDVERLEPSHIAGGDGYGPAALENNFVDS